jgi:hypothetical protein
MIRDPKADRLRGQVFRRTELHRDADTATAKATEWKTALLERGWQ